MVQVLVYDPDWARAFERIRQRVAEPLSAIALRIEHVGSTSVVGLAAKPILDIDVVVRTEADVTEAIRILGTIGYRHRGNLDIPGREAFYAPDDGDMRRHLYVVVDGNVPHREHVDFRDYLRTHPETAHEYAALKTALAARFADDSVAYTEAKTDFVTTVLTAARQERG